MHFMKNPEIIDAFYKNPEIIDALRWVYKEPLALRRVYKETRHFATRGGAFGALQAAPPPRHHGACGEGTSAVERLVVPRGFFLDLSGFF